MTTPRTMPQQFTNKAPIGSLLKHPRGTRSTARSGPVLDAAHLSAIRQLPCIKCGLEDCSESAHVRMNSASHGKHQATGKKPDDKWTVSLCAACHRLDPDSQHKVGEAIFWDTLGLNPLLICEELYAVSPDIQKMRAVIFLFMAGRK